MASRTRLILLLAIAAPLAALFAAPLISQQSLAMRDAAHFYYPLYQWTARQWGAGQIPLWNPQENCGSPVLADASASVFYPGMLIFASPLPFALSFKLYIVGHLVLAAAGAYRLARQWQASQCAAAVAAIAYAYSGNVVFQYCNPVFLVGAAWLPMALGATDRVVTGRSWRSMLLLGLILALMTLGGDPQMAYHVLLLGGVYLLVHWRGPALSPVEKNAPSPVMSRREWLLTHPLLAPGALLAGAAIVGFALAAVQILPAAEAAKSSERAYYARPRTIFEAAGFIAAGAEAAPDEEGQPESSLAAATKGIFGRPAESTHHDRAYNFSVGPWRLAEFFWPNIGGKPFPTSRRWARFLPGEDRIWTPTMYLGLAPVLLALLQFRLGRAAPRVRWLSWLLLLFTVASFGQFGLGWLLRMTLKRGDFFLGDGVGGLYWFCLTCLPAYVNFRYPAKLLIISTLAISQLAALGWDRAFRERHATWERVVQYLSLASGVCALALWLDRKRWLGFGWRDPGNVFGPFDSWGALTGLLAALLQTCVVGLLFVWLWRRSNRENTASGPDRSNCMQICGVLLLAADITVANHWLVIAAPLDIWQAPGPAARLIAQQGEENNAGGYHRVFRANVIGWWNKEFRHSRSRQRVAEQIRWERDTLFPKFGLNHGVSLLESYGSLKSADHESFLLIAKRRGPPQPKESGNGVAFDLPHPAALELLGAEYLLTPDNYLPALSGSPAIAERLSPAPDSPLPVGAALWRMKNRLPRAWVVHQAIVLPPLSGPKTLHQLDQRSEEIFLAAAAPSGGNQPRDFRRIAVVETDLQLPLLAELAPVMQGDPISLARRASKSLSVELNRNQNPLLALRASVSGASDAEPCRIVNYAGARVTLEATLASPGIVVFSDQFDPGWKAQVQTKTATGEWGLEQPVPVLRTNRILRGVALPAGEHRITFAYQPASFYRGLTISGLAWSLLGAAALILAVKRRRG